MDNAIYKQEQEVALIALDNPPVNSLSYALRQDLIKALDMAVQDDAIKAIVLAGSDRSFCSGADLNEFGTPAAEKEPTIFTIIRELESCSKPVFAAITGVCMGGGLEIALACHYRVAHADAKIAFPEIKLGLIPGAGGTQRLPRLVPLETSVNMILSGDVMSAASLADTKLFDEVVQGSSVDAAINLARRVIAGKQPHARVRDLPFNDPTADAYLQFARNTIASTMKGEPAASSALDAISAAAFKPFDQGIRLERDLFISLLASPHSRALRHIFRSERLSTKIPGVPADTPTRHIDSAAIVGAGTMGSGIAMCFLNAGIPARMLDASQEGLDRGVATIKRNYENSLKRGRITEEQMNERLALLSVTTAYEDIADADLVIEAVFEDFKVKAEVFKALDKAMKRDAILATNTSRLDINKIAALTQRPCDVLGMHFFSPANVMRLLEVVRGEATSNEVLATVMQLSRRINKVPVVSGVCDGFIGNRMLNYYIAQSMELLEEGASPQQIDNALESWGMAMGPFRMSDLAGLDIGWSIRQRQYAEEPDSKRYHIADKLSEIGRLGQKNGKGWYRYEPGNRNALPDPAVAEIIAEYQASNGISPRKISNEEIVERCIYALVNEGAEILKEGIAARASDIDLVYLNGYGFPKSRGGPMFYADTVGLVNVERTVRRLSRREGAAFSPPSDFLVELAEQGKSFN